MENQKTDKGWEYNGNVFEDEYSALSALKADQTPNPIWDNLDLEVPTDAALEILYDGQERATSFGTFVTGYLQEHGGSIVALAKKIEVSKQTIFDWMNAKSIPSGNHALRILDVMDCTPAILEEALQDNFQKTKESYFEKLKKA